MNNKKALGDDDIEEAKSATKEFSDKNNYSELVISQNKESFLVSKPWNDDTIEFFFSPEDDKFIECINSVYLPEKYLGIYHTKRKSLEIIYTVFPPTGERADIATRKFEFHHNGNNHICRFDDASSELLTLARHFRPASAAGPTNHRHLPIFNNYIGIKEETLQAPDEIKEAFDKARPISFWIDRVDWDDDYVFDLIMHLNFYMYYFDKETPLIFTHTTLAEGRSHNPLDRFPEGRFPNTIRTNSIEHDLLHFWRASTMGDPSRRFLHNYQILEYAAFYMIEEETYKSIQMLLASPTSIEKSHEIATKIIEAIGKTRIHDSQKVEALLRKIVNPEAVWKSIEGNKEALCDKVSFDGGFSVNSLIKKDWTVDDFKANWPNPFASTIRNIRNALSHGREQTMTSVITPTQDNMRKLQPWVPLISAAAREVMVYRNLS